MDEIINLEETYSLANFQVEVNIQLVKIMGNEKTVLRLDECFIDLEKIDSFRKEWYRLESKLNGWCDIDKIGEDVLSYLLAKKVYLELKVWIPIEDLKDPLALKLKCEDKKDKLEDVKRLFNTAKESREEKLGLIKSLLSSEN